MATSTYAATPTHDDEAEAEVEVEIEAEAEAEADVHDASLPAWIEFESALHLKSFETSMFRHLTVIIARNVGLRDLDVFASCCQLLKLDVSNNQIVNLEGLYSQVALFQLNLANNDLSWSEINRITHINIAIIVLHGNTQLESDDYYREQLVDGLKNVWMIDGVWVTAAEKAYVKRFFHLSTYAKKSVVHQHFSGHNHFVPTRLKNETTKVHSPYAKKVVRRFSPLEDHTLMLDRKRLDFVLETYGMMVKGAGETAEVAIETLSALVTGRQSAPQKCDTLSLLLLASLEVGPLNHKLLVECLHDDGVHLALTASGVITPDKAEEALLSLFFLDASTRCELISVLFSCAKIEHENATFRRSASAPASSSVSQFEDNEQLFNAFIVCLSYVHRMCGALGRLRPPTRADRLQIGSARLQIGSARLQIGSARSRRSPEIMRDTVKNDGFAVVTWQEKEDEDATLQFSRSRAKSARSSATPRSRLASARLSSAVSSASAKSNEKSDRETVVFLHQDLLRKHLAARFVLASWLLSYLQQVNASFLQYAAHDEGLLTLYNFVHHNGLPTDRDLNLHHSEGQTQGQDQKQHAEKQNQSQGWGQNWSAQKKSPLPMEVTKTSVSPATARDLKTSRIFPHRVKVKGFPLPAEPHCFIASESLHRGLHAPPSDIEVEGLDIEQKKPKIGQTVLLNTLTLGRISAIPDTTVILVKITSIPDSPQFGSISRSLMKSPGYLSAKNYMYVNCRNLSWDKSMQLWRPRGTVGDKYSLHYAARPDSHSPSSSSSGSPSNSGASKFRLIDLYGAPSLFEKDETDRTYEVSQPLTQIRKQQISDQLQLLHLPAILQSSAAHLLDILPADLQQQILSNKLSLLDLADAAEQAVKEANVAEMRRTKKAMKMKSGGSRAPMSVTTLTLHLLDQEVRLAPKCTIVGSFPTPRRPTFLSNAAKTPRSQYGDVN